MGGGEIEQEKYFLKGNFNILAWHVALPRLALAPVLSLSLAREKGNRSVAAAGDFLNTLSRECFPSLTPSRSPSLSFVTPADIGGSLLPFLASGTIPPGHRLI